MPKTNVEARYGEAVDQQSARIIDALDEQFEDVDGWIIDDASGVAINGNRNFLMKEISNFDNDGKIHSGVYDAVHKAGLRVTGTYIGVEGPNTCRVWVEEQ